jgi:hypothetical protein
MLYQNKSPNTVGAMKGLNKIHTIHSSVPVSKGKEKFLDAQLAQEAIDGK